MQWQGVTMDRRISIAEVAKKGSIEAGKWADLVVLEEDIPSLAEDRIKDIPVMTVVGGQIVHDRHPAHV
jgi:predicted amidohydrolase YtcJ